MKAALSVALIAFAYTVLIGAVHPPGALAQGGTEKTSADRIKAATGKVDGASIQANARTSRDWPSHGLDYAETRFSRLTQINADNVKALGLVWAYDLESTRGVEATPLVVDGVMYVSASWSVVHAVDVRTGQAAVDLRSRRASRGGLQGLLRRGQPRRGRLPGQGVRRHLRRPPRGPRRRHRAGGVDQGHHHRPLAVVHDHRCATRVQGQGDHRQRRRRVRRARLHHRLRHRDGRSALALVHRAR